MISYRHDHKLFFFSTRSWRHWITKKRYVPQICAKYLIADAMHGQRLNTEMEQEIATRASEYQCPLCLGLAWNPHVWVPWMLFSQCHLYFNENCSLVCGHSFCSKCLGQHKAEHDRKRTANAIGTDLDPVIRCPTCRSLILRKPQFSHTIQSGVESVAKYLHEDAPSAHRLEWSY